MKNEKYPNGYWDKIQYHTQVLLTAVENQDIDKADKATKSLTYFLDKQGALDTKNK
jgi:hypothetical protein